MFFRPLAGQDQQLRTAADIIIVLDAHNEDTNTNPRWRTRRPSRINALPFHGREDVAGNAIQEAEGRIERIVLNTTPDMALATTGDQSIWR